MAVTWNFVTAAGVVSGVAITPTTGGVYDWSEPVTDKGMYAIEIPASGGASANNDTEGVGWITGVATGVLPWRGPTIGFRRAALNDLFMDGGTASTNMEDFFDGTGYAGGTAKLTVNTVQLNGTSLTGRDIGASVLLSSGTGTGQLDFTSGVVKSNLAQILGTALTETAGQIAAAFKKFFDKATPTGTVNSLPDAVAGAAGGLFIAGTNAATSVTTALTANITGNLSGSVGSVTGAVGSVTGAVGSVGTGGITAGSFAAGAIDAAAIATNAIDADAVAADAVTEIQSGLSTLTAAQVNTEVDTALADINLDHLVGTATGIPAVVAGTYFDQLIDDGTAAFDRTTDSLQALRDNLATAAALDTVDNFLDTEVAAIITTLGTPAGVSLAADIAAIEAQTDDIGAAGAGLTAVPWNATWDAEVQSEVQDALDAILADSVPADGTRPSAAQALYMIVQYLTERAVSSTTVTVKKVDGTTALMTFTLDSATTPTSITRTT